MAATNGFLQAVANAVAGLGNTISLHSADPGTTGGSELTGGGYARKTTAWGAAAMVGGSAVVTGSTVRFDVAANSSPTYYGVWNGSTFLYSRPLTPGVTINSAGPGQVDVTPTYTYSQS
ncbi:hypothetical protein SEA_EVANESCE_28 [Mycobacterium phage Evanesce]|uniref:Minor tail protein n=15 Tax=Caudoviricetes TaxID=2731619 RepID=A0A385D042_9CAUD|nr:head protein [Mycobacterium phage Giles]AHY84213.1 hypothetical protein PBI_HH92_28 [Mycobacterium phage HH92]AKQ07804.1 hypothetical protein SEA_KINBOTE_28 [Mycobacterium phage Kinbote]ALA06672.1 hypothetical protein SEA_OBUpride_28 [Mycobacterium phage OBUpride]ALF00249.1 hypothetical protein SEA_EVANESCE_28 [Mycobacterium phage Evanesce]ATN90383.1 hypothetical protein SEA_LILHAZELNUT_28 [Mycobacterium phage LilHazelnut]AXQ51460.1 hypothetical protein SEA_AMOCHICK_28 [Mycobacterium phage